MKLKDKMKKKFKKNNWKETIQILKRRLQSKQLPI